MDTERLDAIKAQLTDRPSDPSATVESFPEGTVGFVILNAWLADRDAARELVAEVENARLTLDADRAYMDRQQAEIDRLKALNGDVFRERDVLRAQREAVLGLHKPLNDLGSPPCAHCLGDDDGESVFVPWPCPTVRALGVSE